jgi:hypothetical protein
VTNSIRFNFPAKDTTIVFYVAMKEIESKEFKILFRLRFSESGHCGNGNKRSRNADFNVPAGICV